MRSKYGNHKCSADGLSFDSKKEMRRYHDLKYRVLAREISELKCQVKFSIDVNGLRICNYIADFTYMERGQLVVEDVKGGKATQTPASRLKVKLMQAVHGITVAIV